MDGLLLVANRGEVAVRIIRAACELGLRTCAVYAEDDSDGLHVRLADTAVALAGRGVRPYLDAAELVAVAGRVGATLVHPGWGFLSESAGFARRCLDAGVGWVGPTPEVLDCFGDKSVARRVAVEAGVPVARATSAVSLDEADRFRAALPPESAVIIKAVAGGGGRGMRAVLAGEDLKEAYARSVSEAEAAFGRPDVYVEELVRAARHVEVQLVGDTAGQVAHLGTRDCSVQRRHQKLIEIAPCPGLATDTEQLLTCAALELAKAVGLVSLATAEFLLRPDGTFVFLEVNPRLQVEHTVTEEAMGIDLVAVQLQIAAGASLEELGLDPGVPRTPVCWAVEARVNTETMRDGVVLPSAGTLEVFSPPAGPGIRVDTAAYPGYRTQPAYDSLLAKVVATGRGRDPRLAIARAERALGEFVVAGVEVNVDLLRGALSHPDVQSSLATTTFVDDHLDELVAIGECRPKYLQPRVISQAEPTVRREAAPGSRAVFAPMPGSIVDVSVTSGQEVRSETPVLVIESMKMEHVVVAGVEGRIGTIAVQRGDTVGTGDLLLDVSEGAVAAIPEAVVAATDPGSIRPDLQSVLDRHRLTQDDARPEAVGRRRAAGKRTARENVADLCDDGTFTEYGALAIAAQRGRRELGELIANTPADGMIGGIGVVNGGEFGSTGGRCAVMTYDYTVHAGTQGYQGHRKKDRLFELVERLRLPLLVFAEGGGGRPGDTDHPSVAGLDTMTFATFGRLSGLVPLVGVVAGRSFAGNAALLGCCDVIIATADSTIGMGGPAMIEGGGLGRVRAEEVGPLDVQVSNGVVDIAVGDEAEAVAVAKKYLSYFQGSVGSWTAADQRLLRGVVPENRRRGYDVRSLVATLADDESVLELRAGWGAGIVTALARIEGRPIGVVANNPQHLGGAIDAQAADKAARFLQLCDAHDLPVLFLCDTPGFMVGPKAERNAQVRHFARLFVIGASLDVPFFTVVVRKAYGLGAEAMAGGSFRAPVFTVSWPTGEFGGMGVEGAVRLGFRKELEAIEDPGERQARYDALVADHYERGKALNAASLYEIDDVIDPASTRDLIVATLRAYPAPPARTTKKRPYVDPW